MIKFILIIVLFSASVFYSQTVRMPRDTVGFCRSGAETDTLIKQLGELCGKQPPEAYGNIVAAISPHDDYLYAGKIYYPLYKLIKAKEIVIFGVTHGTVRSAMNDPKGVLILDNFDEWTAPYGNVKISPLRNYIKKEMNKRNFIVSNKAQSIEHSIEALIPFLQHYNKDIQITPLMITKMSFDKMSEISSSLSRIIEEYSKSKNYEPGKDIFFLISNDANHYGEDFNNSPFGLDGAAHKTATENDKRIIADYLQTKITLEDLKNLSSEIWEDKNKNAPLWCGRYPVVFGLMTANKIFENRGATLKGKLLKYSDTLTEGRLPIKGTNLGVTAPVSEKHWVGFFSAVFAAE